MELSIPTTSISDTSKPYTIYTISIRQSLRNYTLQKRYSDFTNLHDSILSQCNNISPPSALPQKSWFKSTVSSPELTEQRRKGLEEYVQTINLSEDSRWRNCQAWRVFLNLPNNATVGPSKLFNSGVAEGSVVIQDPSVWLDIHRDLKSQLRDARLHLSRRDQANNAQAQHEASADVKRSLVKAGTLATRLEDSLRLMSSKADSKNVEKTSQRSSNMLTLGDGEIRRRKDLLGTARKEMASLEDSLVSFSDRSSGMPSDAVAPSEGNIKSLFQGTSSSSRRVLGGNLKETDQTRELDNAGVLQLQKQIMEEQDVDVTNLTQVVQRMKQMGIQINDELEVQNQMLGMLDQDVERVGDKVKIAKKRIDKIK